MGDRVWPVSYVVLLLQDVVTFVDAFNDEKRSGGSCSVRSAQSAPAAVTMGARASSAISGSSFDGFPEESETGVETLAAAATAVATMTDKSYYFYQGKASFPFSRNAITRWNRFRSRRTARIFTSSKRSLFYSSIRFIGGCSSNNHG